MRLTCSQKDLAKALLITSKAVDVNNTLPVLNNVLIKAEGSTLHFTSTNLEVAITYSFETAIEEEGDITLPARLFTSYISYLKDDQLELKLEGVDMQVKTKDSTTRFKGIASAEFPPIPLVEEEATITLKVGELKKAIGQVVFAAAMNTTRPILSGVYFCGEGQELKLVSTDSYRLSEKKLSGVEIKGKIAFNVPAKTILELGAILDQFSLEQEVRVVVSKNQVMFRVAQVEMISRLIEGQFPNYEQIIPKTHQTHLEFDVSNLMLVLKRINLFAKENNNKVILKVKEEGVGITTEATQYGEGEIVVTAMREGKLNEIALNSQFLLEALTHVESPQVALEMGEKISPMVLRPKDDPSFTHIIMPLKL